MKALMMMGMLAMATGLGYFFQESRIQDQVEPVSAERLLNHQVAESSTEEVQDVLRAKKFELIDEQGRVRITLQMNEDVPEIHLKDEKGRDRVSIFQKPKATGIYIQDEEKHTRIGLAQFPHGGGVAMHGEGGKGSTVLVLMNKKARLDIYNESGKLTDRWPTEKEKE